MPLPFGDVEGSGGAIGVTAWLPLEPDDSMALFLDQLYRDGHCSFGEVLVEITLFRLGEPVD